MTESRFQFRAWDGECYHMVYDVDSIDFVSGFAYYIDSKDEKERCKIECVMQWTGLYDKNGVKIWEGDIVSILPERDVRCIKYDISTARFFADEENSGHDELPPRLWSDYIIVIGNIYEHPHLLSNK